MLLHQLRNRAQLDSLGTRLFVVCDRGTCPQGTKHMHSADQTAIPIRRRRHQTPDPHAHPGSTRNDFAAAILSSMVDTNLRKQCRILSRGRGCVYQRKLCVYACDAQQKELLVLEN